MFNMDISNTLTLLACLNLSSMLFIVGLVGIV